MRYLHLRDIVAAALAARARARGFMFPLFTETEKRIEAEPRLLESGFVSFLEIRLISAFFQCSLNERKTTLELSSRRRVSLDPLGSSRYARDTVRDSNRRWNSRIFRPKRIELARCIDRPTNPEEEVLSRRAIKADTLCARPMRA